MYKLELYKKKNVVEHGGTVDYYKDIKVGDLCFNNKLVATSIRIQLVRQHLFDRVELVEVEM